MHAIGRLAWIGLALVALGAAPASAQDRRASPDVVPGACPFECCRYGRWTATEPLRVFAREGDTTRLAFTLRPGESFRAPTGNVHVRVPGLLLVRDSISAYDSGTGDRVHVAAGDTVRILHSQGEGWSLGWYAGRLVDLDDTWPAQGEAWARTSEAVRLRRTHFDWWVRVEASGGRAGWFLMKGYPVEGADACGG